jgi:hypothetical protein
METLYTVYKAKHRTGEGEQFDNTLRVSGRRRNCGCVGVESTSTGVSRAAHHRQEARALRPRRIGLRAARRNIESTHHKRSLHAKISEAFSLLAFGDLGGGIHPA